MTEKLAATAKGAALDPASHTPSAEVKTAENSGPITKKRRG
jgi:hypothetical protein